MRTFGAGLRAASRNARLLWWLLGANLALAVCAVAPLLRPMSESLSHHEASSQLARRFDMSWWVDLTASHAGTFAAVLDAVGFAALLSALMGCFFAGGLLQAHCDALDGLPMDRFMTCCRRWCARFLGLFALTLPIYWLAHRMINGHLAAAIDSALEQVADERVGLLIGLGRSVLFLALFDLVTLIGDYARVHAVVKADRSMLSSLSAGMRFALAHPVRVGAFEALAVSLQAIALAIFIPLDALLARGAGTAAGLVLAFVATQSFLLVRLFLRETARATQVAIYREALDSSR